jgi:hypothetical protein
VNPQAARGLYVTVGVALGAIAIRAIAARKRSGAQDPPPAETSVSDEYDVPTPLREALEGSRRVQLASQAVSRDTAHEMALRAEGRRPIPGDHRQEVSSLVGPHALAPERDAIGEELVDPGAIEVPIGQSADAEIDTQLSRTKLPQADSTGASLQREDVGTGVQEVSTSLYGGDTSENLTARPNQQLIPTDDAYDAVAPDDLGTEWLTRATEASSLDSTGAAPDAQPPELFFEDGMSVVSEASLNVADVDDEVGDIESDAGSSLEDDYLPADLDELRGKESK